MNAQLQRPSRLPPLLIRASAGAGKTYRLSNRFLELLLGGTEPDEILATTFTRKAAGEILDRVLHRLAEAAGEERKRRELAAALGRKQLTREDCRELLIKVARNLHRLRIGTLDSFFIQIAGSYALEFGLPPGWRIGEEIDDRRLRELAVNRVLNEGRLEYLQTLFHLLTKGESKRAIAGLVHDTVGRIYNVYLDSSPEAWEKIPTGRRLKDEELGAVLAGLQGECAAASNGLRTAIEKDLACAFEQDWKTILGRGISAKLLEGETTYSRKPIPPVLAELYHKLLEHMRGEMLARLADQTRATRDLLANFDNAYEKLKDERQIMRFEDVSRRIAGARAAGSFRLDGRIRHVLLDEFQDTAPAQWKVLRPFARRARTEGTFFCVGDAKQAIYGWRGGVAEIFDALESELDIKPETLAESYRSAPEVIDVVNRVFSGLTKHENLGRHEAGITAFCRAFPTHSTAKTDYKGYVALHVSPAPPEKDVGETHYDYVAELIAKAAAEAPGRSIGVLCRRNDVVARLIYLLRKKGVPASEEGGNPLIDSAPVEAILSLLRMVDHPGNTIASFHVAHTPLGPIVGCTDWRAKEQNEQLARGLRRRLLDEGYGPVILDWAKRLAPDCSERDRNRLQQLIEAAFNYQPQATLRTRDFIDVIETNRVPDPITADIHVTTIHQAKGLEFDIVFLPQLASPIGGQPPACVVGRPAVTEAADVVCRYIKAEERAFLPESMQELFERTASQAANDDLCVLYVALTRAVHALHMVIPPSDASEKKLPKTYAGLLRATLVGTEPVGDQPLAFEHGDPKWYEHHPLPKAAKEVKVEELPTKIPLAQPLAWRTRGWQRATPSSREGGGKISLDAVFKPTAPGIFGRGTLFHAWFEQIRWLDDGPPDEAKLREVARRLGAEVGAAANEIDELLPQFLTALKQKNTHGVLSRDYYRDPAAVGLPGAKGLLGGTEVVVENEFPFARAIGDELLQGSIDRLVIWRRGEDVVAADIVDFKTDGDAISKLAEKTEFYRPQLQAYCDSVCELFELPADRVAARLVFTACDQVVPV